MAETVRGEKERLAHFVKGHGNTHSKLMVLLFWARHPRAKFTLDCIANALDARRLDLRDAVFMLVREGLIEEMHDQNGVGWYRVSGDGFEHFEALREIGWSEVRHLNNTGRQELMPAFA